MCDKSQCDSRLWNEKLKQDESMQKNSLEKKDPADQKFHPDDR
jgi:hypothetical protein